MMIQTVGPSLFQGVRAHLRFESASSPAQGPADRFESSCLGFDVDSIYLMPTTSASQQHRASKVAPLTAATLAGLGSVVIACSHFSV